jgi:hypothetical protein
MPEPDWPPSNPQPNQPPSNPPVNPPQPATLKSKTLMGISKSTIQGWLSVAIAGLLVLGQVQLPAIATTNETHVWIWITWAAAGIAAIMKVVLAASQGDAQ